MSLLQFGQEWIKGERELMLRYVVADFEELHHLAVSFLVHCYHSLDDRLGSHQVLLPGIYKEK